MATSEEYKAEGSSDSYCEWNSFDNIENGKGQTPLVSSSLCLCVLFTSPAPLPLFKNKDQQK